MPRTLLRCFVLVAFVLGGCGSDASSRVPLAIFAASSLTEAFTAHEAAFERENPGVDVQLTFAGSQVLRLQIEQGAAADVFASANPEHLAALQDAGQVVSSVVFARNELVVIVPADNPAGIERFEDLTKASRIVLGSPAVPAGRYADAVLDRSGEAFAAAVREQVVSRETNVRLVRAKVELGEADAAMVYRTDALDVPRIRSISIPSRAAVPIEVPIGVLTHAAHPEAARRFVEHVLSASGQSILAAHGFQKVGP